MMNQGIYHAVALSDIEITRSDHHTGVSVCAEYGVSNGGTFLRYRRVFYSTKCDRIYVLISEMDLFR